MIPRFFYGFLFAPAAGVLLSEAIAWFTPSAQHRSLYFGVDPLLLVFAYGTAVVFGIPAYALYRRFGLTRWWHYALGGAAIGLLAPLLVVALLGASTFFRLESLVSLAYFVTIGIVGALVFWMIAVWGHHGAEV